MNKLTPIDYIENTLSYQPKIILSWVTEGIVINNKRYSIKEFRLKEDGKLYAVIAENKYNSDYFEVQLCPDEETLKQILASIAAKEQTLESTRNTIAINHGSNGTSKKTKVDTNPEKVLEHDNLTVGDALTKEHTGNTTNLNVDPTKVLEHDNLTVGHGLTKTHVNGKSTTELKVSDELINAINSKQEQLVAGNGITIQDNTISANTSTSQEINQVDFGKRGQGYYVIREVYGLRTTYTIEIVQGQAEFTAVEPLKTELASVLSTVRTITSGAITLTYDGTNVKIINNNPSSETTQQATFSFYTQPSGPGV